MPKLFLAVELPAAATAELVRIQPPPTSGVRLVEQGQMHLTLHYIGEADVERLAAALSAVAAPPFSVAFEGVGQFPSADGAVTLWAGVRATPKLLDLHAHCAAALAGAGFMPEGRRYTPHVTLARCEAQVRAGYVDEFLNPHGAFSLPDVPIAGFGLYSSRFVGDTPAYQRERSFVLPTFSRPRPS